uniref:Uncharacterized protein n=1 Tax=Heterorhabditis bacteriophora TaxID=37862 RepID=A0A1I7WZU2_HETBA
MGELSLLLGEDLLFSFSFRIMESRAHIFELFMSILFCTYYFSFI